MTGKSCSVQDDVAGCFEYYADLAEKQDKQLETPVELPMAEFTSVIRHEPLGPVALISSFNYPMLIATVRCAALLPSSANSEPACSLPWQDPLHCGPHQQLQLSHAHSPGEMRCANAFLGNLSACMLIALARPAALWPSSAASTIPCS